MRRHGMAVLAFGLGILAFPFASAILEVSSAPVAAQDDTGLGVELPTNNDPGDNQDLIVVEPVAEDAESVYMELARQKAKLLSREQLQLETQVLQRELQELQATQKLKDLERQLQQLVKEHPNTDAAARALFMLERHEGIAPTLRHRNGVGVPIVPTPDAFERGSQFSPPTFDSFQEVPARNPARKKGNELPTY